MDTTQLMDKEYDTPCGLTAISSLPEHKVLLECPIAGLAYHDISDVWDELYVGAKLALVREKHNKYDTNAVAVALADDYDGDPEHFDFDLILGYVPKTSNAAIATLLDMGWEESFKAEISELKSKSTEHNSVKMTIYVVNKETILRQEELEAPLMALQVNKKDWRQLHKEIWKHGFVYFRWRVCCLYPHELDKIKRSMNVLIYERDSVHTQMLLMKIIATDDDCYAFIRDPNKIECIDDCSAFVLTSLDETLNIKNEDIPAVEMLGSCSLRPRLVADKSLKLQVLQCFTTFGKYIND